MSNTRKDLLTEKDDRWRTKGVPHKEKVLEPFPCSVCGGFGWLEVHKYDKDTMETCSYCDGTGEVYE